MEDTPGKGSDLAGKAAFLEGLVRYQEGAVVSRQVMAGGGGNVTIFAFDKGEGLTRHTTPYTALAYVLDGEAEITVGDTPLVLKRGEATILPADTPHAVRALMPFKMMLVMMRS